MAWVGGGRCWALGGGLVGWVWLALVSSRAGVWASVPRVGSGWLVGWLVGRPGGPLVGGGWASLVYVRAFSLVLTFDVGQQFSRAHPWNDNRFSNFLVF